MASETLPDRDLDSFRLTGNSPKPKRANPASSPINTSLSSPSLQPRQRPKTPPGLSKNQAKKWRKNWDYEEKKRLQAVREQQKQKQQQQQQQKQSKPAASSSSMSLHSQMSHSSPGSKHKRQQVQQRALPQYDNPHTKKKSKKQALVQRIPIDKEKQIQMFAHLPQNEKYLFYISPTVTSEIHPVILRAGLYYNDGTSWGANTRCITMLNAFKIVVNDFKCPSNKSFARELLIHLNPCIQFLNDCRPQSVSMGNTIRWLKTKITQIAEEGKEDEFLDDDDIHDEMQDINDEYGNELQQQNEDELMMDEIPRDGQSEDELLRNKSIMSMANTEYNEDQQKNKIIQAITDYVFKIETADKMIQVEVVDRIKDGDVILTYARSYVVEKSLMRAYYEGKRFKVVIVDARPHNEGKILLDALSSNCPDLDISYTLINSASYVMSKEVNKVILGAACIMSNGSVVSRAGTATIALVARHYKIPVMVCCETYKFSERVQIDSICSNELGDFDALIRNGKDKPSKHDKQYQTFIFAKDRDQFSSKLNLELDEKTNEEESQITSTTDDENDSDEQDNPFKNKLLGNWRNIPKLKMMHLKYDTTPSKLIKMVITELGVMPPSSAPVIIRECHKDRQLS